MTIVTSSCATWPVLHCAWVGLACILFCVVIFVALALVSKR